MKGKPDKMETKMETKTNKYVPAPGAHLNEEQAQRYGDEVEALQATHNGELTARMVVTRARTEGSPLYDWFEWRDRRAADLYRLNQARYLLRSIHIVIKRDDGVETTTRAWVNVTIQKGVIDPEEETTPQPASRQVYVAHRRAYSEEDLRRQAVNYALRQLVGWRDRFQQYKEFAEVHKAIGIAQERLNLAPEAERVAA